jgi:hypothetical protein
VGAVALSLNSDTNFAHDAPGPRVREPEDAMNRLMKGVLAVCALGSSIHCSAGSDESSSEALSGARPVNRGLLMRGPTPPPERLTSVVHGYIIEGQWDVLQPNKNEPIVTASIDSAVSAVRAWNKANPKNLRGLRLRIEAGIHAPTWVQSMSGGPVEVSAPSGETGIVPRWWTQPVEDAYAHFVSEVAAYVDPIAEIREVTVGLTMEFFGEICIRFPAQNAAALEAAGFTQALDVAAMESSFRAHLAFKHAVTQIDVNAYEEMSGATSLTVTQELMDYVLGLGLPAVQFANASLTDTGNDSLYTLMKGYGPNGSRKAAITFQTMPTVASMVTVLDRAISFGATSVEVPTNPGTASVLAPLDKELMDN